MFEKIIKRINKANSVGIFTHINPDGDAMGSAFSLKIILNVLGKSADVFYSGETESCLMELIEGAQSSQSDMTEYDLLIALDCAALDRLGKWSDDFEKHSNTAAIDHHITHSAFAKETVVGDVSSTCELMYSLYKEMKINLSVEAAKNLYIGMVTDTGNFKFSSVTGDTHRVAAELIDIGVDFAAVSKVLFDTVTREYLDLKTKATAGMKFFLDDRVAILTLEKSDFEESGITEADASGLVSLPVSVKGVEVGVYMRARKTDGYKISLRSVNYVDVSKIAASFGGGGHIRAAAYSVTEEEATQNIKNLLKEIEKQL